MHRDLGYITKLLPGYITKLLRASWSACPRAHVLAHGLRATCGKTRVRVGASLPERRRIRIRFPRSSDAGFVSGYRFSDTAKSSKSDAPLGARRGWWAAYTFLLRAEYFAIADQAGKPERFVPSTFVLRSFYEGFIRNLWPVVSNTVESFREPSNNFAWLPLAGCGKNLIHAGFWEGHDFTVVPQVVENALAL